MPTIAEIKPLAALLRDLHPGAPLTHGAVTVIPLLRPAPDPDWLTLAEAGGAVAVTEVSEAGDVPTLRLTNAADRPVLLLDGEELVGAKQNRVLNTTVLVAARATVVLPVSCVEQGRWRYRARRFTSSGVSLYASLRRQKTEQVSRALKFGLGHQADQGAVWDLLAAKAADHKVEGPTGAMHDVYERYAGDVEAGRQALGAVPDQAGAVVFVGGRWAGVEALASPGLFARAWPRLCAGYLADGFEVPAAAGLREAPGQVVDRLLGAGSEPAPAVGLGTEHRLAGAGVVGAALLVDDRVAHLMAFPAE